LTLTESTAASLAARVRAREVSAVEVAEAHLARLHAVEPQIDAFLHVATAAALDAARAVDAAVARGEQLPLAGVPVAVKDALHVAGSPTTCGSRILDGYRPPFTATAVRRLQESGAVVLGKTNMDEFAMGSSTENSAFKPTRNPWDLSRVPGGSSGGSAAAVAARAVPVALGSDTGGSIRQPAALCGVVGFKPTYGRVSRFGLVAFASSLDQVGPLARTVEDAQLLCDALFGHDPRDATSADASWTTGSRADALPLRVGVPRAFLEQGVDAGVLRAFEDALAVLEGAGAEIRDVDLPHAPHAIATYYLVATAEASSNLARFDGVRYGLRASAPADLAHLYGDTRDQGFGAEVKRRILLGTFALSSGYYDAYYARAQAVRALIRGDLERAFATCDVIATPTTPSPAFRLGEKKDDPLQMYLADVFTVTANLAGIPAVSLPCGLAGGLPVGLQLQGPWFGEERLCAAGRLFQQHTAHHLERPPLSA
jgi:aspartyl-tRNA(Asn)/glutamyl-tRNA(Gln) amidotransferase subunit A